MALGILARSAFGRVASGAKFVATGGEKGLWGAMNVAGYGVSAYAAHQTYGEKYGGGAAVGIGLGEAAAFTLLPAAVALPVAAIGYGAYHAVQFGKAFHKERREIRLGRPVQDLFGTMATMRQRSVAALGRGRGVLGHEARLMHY